MMEFFFRVDAFIPVYVQMYHVLRRLLEPSNPCGAMAVGVVLPTHHTGYFIDAVRRMRRGASRLPHSAGPGGGESVPPVLVYSPSPHDQPVSWLLLPCLIEKGKLQHDNAIGKNKNENKTKNTKA
ncbi:hypothetical protein TraAM80_01923 [Trypanosoma rangeli]|uniref:Uncharacterized protein n=1 Tax=Trypanosoma rangeli TaxID=5698 RepID=A0A3R7NYJ7_TRYRA|nr:uncharacterized protein TraAM80_01923 [Trypanosoma rangeli]RNF09789.1 hypothetical protein TraAM80_01923 [Trypanosoma rangeli]|eukprot:RNF09789.1 hypothetical protein TraAM80_01923 [Trypanosoma rangeli]